jgi:aldehyde:ferredoxin oxidoreductase
MSLDDRSDVLRVDLSARTVSRESVPESWRRRYLGGKGMGARYLYHDLDANVDPLGPENLLGFMLGPLSGHLPGESRYAAVTKSPLTGAFLDSYSGGRFPDRLAGSLDGCLGLLVTGRADEPVRIDVSGGDARVEPAASLWGLDTVETSDAVDDAAVACIGPAGEAGVGYATIASDAGNHHAGRGGAGAVMGAKGLKAVVVHDAPPEPSPALATLTDEYADRYREHDTGRWQAAGATLESVDFANEVGALATRGWQESQFEGGDDIGIEAAADTASGRERADDAVPGGFRVETDAGESVPRGATPMTLGAGLGVDEFDAVAALGTVCDRLGLDVISGGNAVAWAIRATDIGAVSADDLPPTLDTEDLVFGDDEVARTLLRAIARREGPLADALAGGVDAAATRFGAAELIPTVKSMELPAYDPRAAAGMALAYATSDRGGCHRRARPIEREAFEAAAWTPADRVRAVVSAQNVRSVLWSLVVDDFAGETLHGDLGAEWLAAVGRDYDRSDLVRVGERVWTLVRLFNAREEFDRTDDTVPAALRAPLPDGPAAGRTLDVDAFERLLDLYYAARDWGPNGIPTQRGLSRLGLADLVDDRTPLDDDPLQLGTRSTPDRRETDSHPETIDD